MDDRALDPTALADYVGAVEAAFLDRTGRGLMLSARDVDRVQGWARSGAPVEVALAAMGRLFDSAPQQTFRGLAVFSPAVEAANTIWRAQQDSAAQRRVDLPVEQALAFKRLLDGIAQAGRRQTPGPKREVLREIWRAVDLIRTDEAEDKVRALDLLKSRATALILRAMGPQAAGELEREVDQALRAEKERVTEAVYSRTRQARLWRSVRVQLGLPELALRIGQGW